MFSNNLHNDRDVALAAGLTEKPDKFVSAVSEIYRKIGECGKLATAAITK